MWHEKDNEILRGITIFDSNNNKVNAQKEKQALCKMRRQQRDFCRRWLAALVDSLRTSGATPNCFSTRKALPSSRFFFDFGTHPTSLGLQHS